MQLNNEELHLFIEGMKNSRENHAEENKSFEYGLNGRLHSRNGKLSYSSIKGTIEIYNNPDIVKYLGYFSFSDELVLLVKYASKIISNTIIVNTESIFVEDIVVTIPSGQTQYNFINELTINAIEEIVTTSETVLDEPDEPLIKNYDESITSETIDLSDYYSLGSSSVPSFEICDLGGIESVPEYNKTYSDAIIILKKEKDKSLTPRIAWLGNMNWDINRKITTVGIFENNYYKRVYFTDNLNPLRVFNLKDNSLNYRVSEEFDINQKSILLQPYISEITNDGSIKAMSVQYAYLLITENGQATPFSPYSKLELIVKEDDDHNFSGGDIKETTNKAVKIKCPIISTLYKEIQCIAIEYQADTIPTAIRNLGKKDVAEIVEFLHTGNEAEFSENFTLEDITETDNIWTYCNDITTRRNRLIAAGLRNEPYALQEKYIEDLFLFKGWDVNGNTHDSLINPEPQTYDHFDPTNIENSLFLKKQLYTRFLFFGNTTLTLKNSNIDGSDKSITFTSSSDEYIDYIDEVYNWLLSLDLSDFPNLLISRSNNSILFEPIDESIETDFSNYRFKTSVSQVIIDFQNEWSLLEPNVNVDNLIYGAQSYGFNKGAGVRISFKEIKEPVLEASSELYVSGPILKLKTPSLNKTFVKDETYRMSIQFFKNGNPLFTTVLGDIKIPKMGAPQKYLNNSGNVVIDEGSLYLNQSEVSTTNSEGDVTLVLMAHRIEMEVEVRIPCEFKSNVDSFQIMYVERTENNRTILAQGISAPLIRLATTSHPSQGDLFEGPSGNPVAPNMYGKWTLPFNGGPLYAIHGLLQVYDDPNYGENWDDIDSFPNDWDNNSAVKNRVMRREIPNRKMFYFDSPDIINERVSSKNISNGKIEVLGRLNTDHTHNLIRSRYPYSDKEGIHNGYLITSSGEYGEIENYKDLSFSKKIGYKELAGLENSKPYVINISVFSKFSLYNSKHSIEKISELLNKGEIIPSAVLGTSYQAVNKALSLFSQNAFNSSLWLSGIYNNGSKNGAPDFYSNNSRTSVENEGYPSVFIRANDDVFTNNLIGDHITNPIYTKAHINEGDAKNVDIDGNVGNYGGWVGVPVTDTHALINIKMSNELSIYGGRSKYAFSQNVFIPLSKVIPTKGAKATNQSQKFKVQGDFYTSLYIRTKNDFSGDFESTEHKMNQDNYHKNSSPYIKDYNRGGAWAYAVVLETEVESRLSSDYKFYRGEGSPDFSLTLNEFINSAYFKKNNLRIYNPVPWNFKDDPLLTNILSASKVKLNGDIFDSWTTFLLNEFYELEKAKGIITNVTNWGDEIYAIQELETNKINIDTSDFVTTQSGEQVAIQKGDGTTFTSHEKISNFGTSIRRALAEGEFGFSFFDEYNKEFVKISKPISLEREIQQKLQELFQDDRIINTEGYYDSEYKETNILINTESGNSYMLSYNELEGVFNGYIEYNNDIYIMFDKRVFAPIRGSKTETIICPVITSSDTLDINVDEYFTYQITADNNPLSFNATNLPDGVNVNKNTGVIFGRISNHGTYSIIISASNECGTTELTLNVSILQYPPVITSPCFGIVQSGDSFSYQIEATNNPTTFNATGLPAGLSIDSNGLITGILPTDTGTYPIVLIASNSSGTDTKECDLVISNTIVSCSEDFSYSGQVGTFSFQLNLGTGIGNCGINYNAYSVPDRFRIEYDGVEVADSGYVGSNNYDNSLLAEGVNPSDINTENPPNGVGILTFNKTTAEPQFATVFVDAVLGGTAWNISGICPPSEKAINIINSFSNSCYSYWNIKIIVPVGETRTVKIGSTFAPAGKFSESSKFGYSVTGEEVVANLEETISSDKIYTIGIDGNYATGTILTSSISVELKNGTTVIDSKNLNKQHTNSNC